MNFNCRIKDGVLLTDKVGLKDFISKQPDGAYEFEIKKLRDRRSVKANKFYWGYVLPPISDITGYTKEELHDIFKVMFNKQIKELNGVMIEYGATTTELKVEEFQHFIDRVIQYAGETFQIEFDNLNQ